MTLPSIGEMKSQIIEFLKDNKLHTLEETKQYITKRFKISAADRSEMHIKRNRSVFDTRMVQALSDLRKHGVIENRERGKFKMKAGNI